MKGSFKHYLNGWADYDQDDPRRKGVCSICGKEFKRQCPGQKKCHTCIRQRAKKPSPLA